MSCSGIANEILLAFPSSFCMVLYNASCKDVLWTSRAWKNTGKANSMKGNDGHLIEMDRSPLIKARRAFTSEQDLRQWHCNSLERDQVLKKSCKSFISSQGVYRAGNVDSQSIFLLWTTLEWLKRVKQLEWRRTINIDNMDILKPLQQKDLRNFQEASIQKPRKTTINRKPFLSDDEKLWNGNKTARLILVFFHTNHGSGCVQLACTPPEDIIDWLLPHK